MFQGNTILSGLCFLIGILINSRKASLYTILGALLPIPLAILLEVDATDLNAGLMGYNGVLCAIALGGTAGKVAYGQDALSYYPPCYQILRNEFGYHYLNRSLCYICMDHTNDTKSNKNAE